MLGLTISQHGKRLSLDFIRYNGQFQFVGNDELKNDFPLLNELLTSRSILGFKRLFVEYKNGQTLKIHTDKYGNFIVKIDEH